MNLMLLLAAGLIAVGIVRVAVWLAFRMLGNEDEEAG